jgi:hypothetical protein
MFELRHELKLPVVDNLCWKAWYKLLLRPWFSRRWILQEVVLAREVWVSCGAWTMSWSQLSRTIALSSIPFSRSESGSDVELGAAIHNLCPKINAITILSQRESSGLPRLRLVDILYITQEFHCSEILDNLYAVLSISADTALQPDYGQTFHDASIQYTSYLATHGCLCSLLTCVYQHKGRDDLPSWVPDWSSPTSRSRSL